MLLKWIVCVVPAATREAFSAAQAGWGALAGVDGFAGQVGGWDRSRGEEACIFGLWRDPPAYRAFMAGAHDEIVRANGQAGTYASITTGLFEPVLDMPGSVVDMGDGLESAGHLRIADCEVKPGRTGHFLDVQRNVWRPGMAAAEGMLAGLFGVSSAQSGRFLVATLWRDAGVHDAYVEHALPGLRAAAQVERDLASLRGWRVQLEPSWLVRPISR